MKKIVIGILAHVDAGKTTLSESMLYLSGKIRRLGRVDNRDAYLDTYELERARGITIFSKQAIMNFDETEITLLDTPGHVDFSAEMERTLQVLDYAILVISGSDGIQSHTRTLWNLLELYNIPTFIFVNKMDQKGTDKDTILMSLQDELGDECIAFNNDENSDFFEQLAMCDEEVMEDYLGTGEVLQSQIISLIESRKVFPVYFGSALKQIGTETFIKEFINYIKQKNYPKIFGAKVFKISRDEQGNRLTHFKITGGELKVKDVISLDGAEEKVNQIRLYSGEKYHTKSVVSAGEVCAVTGLTKTRPGDGIGFEEESRQPHLEPVLSYRVVIPDEIDVRQVLPKLREIEEEEPELKVVWNEALLEINIQVMGAVQLEILESVIMERFNIKVGFDHGDVVYKETVTTSCEGVGHFEPLRHYAEVHLMIEPAKRGTGLQVSLACSEDILDKNWQRLVLTHLREKIHKGVLIGAPITDLKITLVAGRAHNKHTVGGDFREATFRALRQGLMESESILLEPYYNFRLILPEALVGRAMTDISNMQGHCTIHNAEHGVTVLIGDAPVVAMRNYQQEVNAYTKGEGRLTVTIKGYDVCHNQENVVERYQYEPELDFANPTGSVFCAKGTGYSVPWYEVKKYMHVESVLKEKKEETRERVIQQTPNKNSEFISLEEIDDIIGRTYSANQGKKSAWKKPKGAVESYYESFNHRANSSVRVPKGEKYLLVDGYNIIHAWEELKGLTEHHMDGARQKLMEILSNYQPLAKCEIIVVFDAYRVEGRKESIEQYHNIKVVFTAEAQTADQFIEKFAHTHKTKHQITVATSDGLQQIIIRGAGARLLSARDLHKVVMQSNERLKEEHLDKYKAQTLTLKDVMTEEEITKLQTNK